MCLSAEQVASPAARQFLRLTSVPDVGPILCNRLLEAFGGVERIFEMGRSGLQRVEGVGPTRAQAICQAAKTADVFVEQELELAAKQGVRILCQQDLEYPAVLKQIPDPPICLYVRGSLRAVDELAIAIVGSRRHTHYGMEQAKRFAYALANIGLTIVSGMARGIDSFAHLGALEAGGRTIAVLGNGLARVYPPENVDLHDRITQEGAVLSELPMTTSPESKNFPARNRIIAGLTLGVVVIEATERSGAQITARLANEYNREVYAVPGRVDSPNSFGPNVLIRDAAAKLVLSPEDILIELGSYTDAIQEHIREASDHDGRAGPRANEPARTYAGMLTPDEQKVFAVLDLDGLDPDQIAQRSGAHASVVASSLVTLQLKSLVKRLPGNTFIRLLHSRGEPAGTPKTR